MSKKKSKLDRIHKPTGLPVREVFKEEFRRESAGEANCDPLPGPLALAFPARPIRVGAFSVRPVSGLDLVVLRGLDSPLIKQMAEARKPKEQRKATEFSDEAGWEMVLQFLLTDEEAEAELAKGREHFRKRARQEIGRRMNPIIVNQIVQAIVEQFLVAFTTAVEFSKSSTGEPKNDEVFTKPPTTPTTGSGGGSATSVG